MLNTRADQLLKNGEVKAIIGLRAGARRAVFKIVKNVGILALGAGVTAAVTLSVLSLSAINYKVESGHVISTLEPRAAPKVITEGANVHQTMDTNQLTVSNSIDSALAATLDRVSKAENPNTIPNLLLAEHQPFLALTTRLESFQPNAYFDSGGLNVGYGYCISKRSGEAGVKQVHEDLTQAGFSDKDINTLLNGKRAEQEKVQVSPIQALHLLAIAQEEYIMAARITVGGDTFDALPPHRQAALSWLTYNTGGAGFAKFRNLIEAVQDNRPIDAVNHITPRFIDESGNRVVNARAGTALIAAYWNEKGLKLVIENLETLTFKAKNGASPLLAVEPNLKVTPGNLPMSPYLMSPGTVDITTLTARYTTGTPALSVDSEQYNGNRSVIASKAFGSDDRSMKIFREIQARKARGEEAPTTKAFGFDDRSMAIFKAIQERKAAEAKAEARRPKNK